MDNAVTGRRAIILQRENRPLLRWAGAGEAYKGRGAYASAGKPGIGGATGIGGAAGSGGATGAIPYPIPGTGFG